MFREHVGIRVLYYAVFTALLALALYAFYVLLLTLIAGFLLAFLLDPIVDWLERRRWSRSGGALTVLAGLFALLGSLAAVFFPRAVQQMIAVFEHRGEYLAALESRVTVFKEQLSKSVPQAVLDSVEQSARHSLASAVHHWQEALPGLLGSSLHAVSSLLFVILIAYFFLVEGAEIKKWFVSHLPNRYFEMSLMMMHQIGAQLGGYLRGQAMDCLINGALYALGLSLLGVKGAVLIGIFAGLMNAVPYVGPIVGAIPGMISLMMDPTASMPWWSVAVLFTVVHLADNAVIYPMTVGKSLNLPPFVVILGILFGGSVAGIPGMFLTVPLLGIIKQTFTVLHSSLKSYRIIG